MITSVSISAGNAKLGVIPSVSLPACVTCNPSAPCFKSCYARRMAARRANVREAYAHNLEILNSDPARYWEDVKQAATMARFFRYHVSGDIPDDAYFAEMVKLASELPHTSFLAFTKQFEIVNRFIDAGGKIPENLKIIFSNWGAWKCDNPYGLPVCEVILRGNLPADEWKICGGNCSDCACRGVGCWEVKNGETIAIYQH